MKTMYTSENLSTRTSKELLEIAKEWQIVGRHKMSKSELLGVLNDVISKEQKQNNVVSITKSESDQLAKRKKDYIEGLEVGRLIAFTLASKEKTRMESGKVVEISTHNVKVEMKNGTKLMIQKSDIQWVKTGTRWPKWIYNSFKSNYAS